MIAPGALSRFQDDFARALISIDEKPTSSISTLTTQPAFAVYRNTVMKACIDALQANYPVVTRLVGEEWFRAAAAIFVRESLPTMPMLLNYGANFSEFLAQFEPAAELPYLPGVALLDRYWTESHIATSENSVDAADIQKIAPVNFFHSRLNPHASARWAWFENSPVYSIWAGNRSDSVFEGDVDWRPEGALLTRQHDAVTWQPIGRDGCAFLDVCAGGGTLAEAIQTALEINPEADIGKLIAHFVEVGAFSQIDINPNLK